jgi:hypothetical protein
VLDCTIIYILLIIEHNGYVLPEKVYGNIQHYMIESLYSLFALPVNDFNVGLRQ